MEKKGGYFKNLDSIRFIAATMVFLYHTTPNFMSLLNIKGTWIEAVLNVVFDGGIGVSVFFVLSGFLITYLLIAEYELKSGILIRNFYIRRILRIWPLYYAVVALAYSLVPIIKLFTSHGVYNYSPNYEYYLFFLSNFDILHRVGHAIPTAPFQRLTWSVSVEEQFYVFWPLIFTFLKPKYWIHVILLVIFGSLLFRLRHYDDPIYLSTHTFSVLLDLGIGGLTAFLIKKYESVNVFFETRSTWTHFTLFITAFILLILRPQIALLPYGLALGRLFISSVFALIIACQAITKSNSPLNLGNLKFASRWGKYTYGIYLLHPLAIFIIENCLGLAHIKVIGIISETFLISTDFILTLFISYISYTYYESWFLSLKKKFEIIPVGQ